jgi:hypothetical protein
MDNRGGAGEHVRKVHPQHGALRLVKVATAAHSLYRTAGTLTNRSATHRDTYLAVLNRPTMNEV